MTAFRKITDQDLPGIYEVAHATGLAEGRAFEAWRQRFVWAGEQSRACFGDTSDPLGIVAEDQGRIIGYAACSYRLLRVGDRTERAVVNNALAVSPNAQGSLGLLLCREFFNQFAIWLPDARILAFHHSKPAGLIWSRFGAAGLDGSDMTLRLLVSPASLVAKRFSLGDMAASLLALPPLDVALGHLLAHRGLGCNIRGARPPGITFLLSDELDDSLANSALFSKCAPSNGFGVLRDHAYLKWRYHDHPDGHYRFVTLRRRDDVVGLLIFDTGQNGYSRLYEALIVRGEEYDDSDRAWLIVAAARHIGVGVMVTKLLEPVIAAAFETAGAVSERKGYNQFWYTGERGETLTPHFSYGDFSED
jgi:hypothetical protein